ncbi:carbon-nitrogen hydrolase family protein [Rufibacter glacialis]|uniref:Carbon-nitrogen hydrolase family protein n=1 Tax=Rufibacter glacialis TaxID=1259555 RepID=A0A5M8QBY2_9BACT|nr:carbon-nitrogen hydrolase family protein [Rufibacter glacialis]KAA6432464.1 carbon-nitrogen hydrolase family protein [Rufibacter glacialis]GGK78888.1 amidohydrolase [Rufibacter glacialis]
MESEKIKVAAVQMDCVLGDREANLRKAEKLVVQALKAGARLIVLPELFNTGYRVEERDVEMAETIPGPTVEWMQHLARKHSVYIAAAILEQSLSKGLVYDTAVLVGPEELLGTYRKTHLWDVESIRFTKGDAFPVFQTAVGNIGLQICYEVGFPEGARVLALQGADILLYPSAFGKARGYAWKIATRSRALENGAYVIAANRTGTEKEETEFGGGSCIVNPWGEVTAEASEENEVIVSEIDLREVVEQRRRLPYLRDMNRSLFAKLYG